MVLPLKSSMLFRQSRVFALEKRAISEKVLLWRTLADHFLYGAKTHLQTLCARVMAYVKLP